MQFSTNISYKKYANLHSFSTILFALNENKEPKNSNKSKFSLLQQKANVFYAFLWQVCQERVKKACQETMLKMENGIWIVISELTKCKLFQLAYATRYMHLNLKVASRVYTFEV